MLDSSLFHCICGRRLTTFIVEKLHSISEYLLFCCLFLPFSTSLLLFEWSLPDAQHSLGRHQSTVIRPNEYPFVNVGAAVES
ncbi:hypothetical protein TSMEX_010544 [Taenia solium]|eukprot:TsM_000531100 transcript=TsM_000531100 gene=TsM_000531100